MSDPEPADLPSLDELAAAIAACGWVFEIVVMGVELQAEPVPHMTAQVSIGRIYTPGGDVERWDVTPQAALAAAFAEAVRIHGAVA